MKKVINKILCILLVTFVIFGNISNIFGADLKTKLDVIEQSSETKYLENDQGYVSKKIVNSNAQTGEVTIELKLSNTKQESTTVSDTEIFFVIDNSPSMEYVTESGDIRKDLVTASAKELANSIFEQSNSVKIGIVKFSGTTSSIYSATLVQALSDDKDTVINAIERVANGSTVSGTNIDAGLQRAYNNFSSDCQNKIIVLLTDGVPTSDASGTSAGNDTTTEKSYTVQANTKATIERISNSGVYLISMMTGLDLEDSEYTNELAAITNVFGTVDSPTAGKFYNISDADISNIVNNNILTDVIEKIQNPINEVKVVDYFPEDITENFEFSYVGKPNLGTVSEGIDEETKTITWDIGTLRGDEAATLQYKLKVKDMGNTSLLNKTISTNEKVVLTYTDVNSQEYTVTLTSSPKIQLSEVQEVVADPEEPKEPEDPKEQEKPDKEKPKDTTTTTGKLPDTGLKIGIVLLLTISVIGIIAYVKSNKLKGI